MMNLKIDPSYSGKRESSVILTGRVKGLRFAIVDHGSHPCAYVAVPWRLRKKDYNWFEQNIDVHGGITFLDKHTWLNWFTDRVDLLPWRVFALWSMIIGWDYAHAFDYTNFGPNLIWTKGRMWSTQEIYNDVVYVVEQFTWNIYHDKKEPSA